MTIDLFAVRSLLFLPASNPRAIAKAREAGSDVVVLDLEDAVKPEDKDLARSAAIEAAAHGWPMPVAIRVNCSGTRWFDEDAAAVQASRADFVILPRASEADEVARLADKTGKRCMAMIETAQGVLAAPAIAGEAAALIAGTNDLRADLRLPLDASRAPISASLQWIVLAARAAEIPAIDGVFNGLADEAGLEAECAEGRALGFDGKSLIHPNQIATCHRLFAPNADELERARKLVEAFSGGAERFEDRMIERMHVEAARRLLSRYPTGAEQERLR